MSTPSDSPDHEHAKKVRETAESLNAAVVRAYDAGLRVDLDIDYHREIGQRLDCPLVRPTVERVEEL